MRWLLMTVLTLWLGVVDSRAQSYPTPGFDCANVSTAQELRICRSAELSELDGRHWYLAERAIRGSREPEKTRSDVEGWINNVRNECQTDKCLTDAYGARLAELERNVATLAPVPPPPPPIQMPPAPPSVTAAITRPSGEAPAPLVPSPLPPVVVAPEPAPAPKVVAKPAPAPEPVPEEDTPLWPWLLAAAVIAASVAFVALKK